MKARNLPPALIRDYKLVKLQPVTRLLFIALQCMADRAGIIEDDHEQIAFDCGLMGFDCESELNKLVNAGILSRHKSTNGKRLLKVVEWDKYQRPHHTEGKSKFVIDESLEQDCEQDDGMDIVQVASQTRAGRICKILREQCRMQSTSPSDPRLQQAIDAGATDDDFLAAGHEAVSKGMPLGWFLGAVNGRLRDAKMVAKGGGAAYVKNTPKARKTGLDEKLEEDRMAREAAGVPVSPF